MRLTAFFKLCKICILLHRCNLKIVAKQSVWKFWDCSGAEVCKSCRAWKMLSNAYFLAKIRFDTAENEPAKSLQTLPILLTCPPPSSRTWRFPRSSLARRSPAECLRSSRGSAAPRRRGGPRRAGSRSAPPPALRRRRRFPATPPRRRVSIELNFSAKLRGARSWLYRRRFHQANTRWKARAEIYTVHSFAPFFKLKKSAKNRQHFFAID